MPASSPSEPAIQTAARLLAEGRPAEAVARLAALTAETPTYAAAHVLYATALEAAGDVERALASWAHAATLVPLSPLVHREHARLLAVQAGGGEDAGGLASPNAPSADAATPADVTAIAVSLSGRYEDELDRPAATADLLAPEGPAADQEPPTPEPPAADEGHGWSLLAEGTAEPSPPPAAELDVVAPEESPGSDAGPSVADELDALIAQLEDAPRIKPDPAFEGPAVRFDQDGTDEVASETLAQIYAAQRQYAEAALIYEKLAAREPERAAELLERAAEMRDRA